MTEAEDNNDIILEDFHDTYLNLTLKTSFLLKWLETSCSQAKFVLKVDDDVFVNPDRLWTTLEDTHLYSIMVNTADNDNKKVATSIDYALIGHVMKSSPIRDPESKWYLPPTFYPLNIFPTFLSGTAYVFTGSLVPVLYSCTLK